MVLSVSGCADLGSLGTIWPKKDKTPEVLEAPVVEAVDAAAKEGAEATAEAVPTPVEPAVAKPASKGVLGITIATLDASAPGVWLKTPLVSKQQAGQLAFGSKTVNATLIPVDGPTTGGSFISLEAMRSLGAPLTGFPEIKVTGL